jgi:ribosomal protein S17E
MYFTGDYQTTYQLMANIPEIVSKLLRNAVLESFKTLEY